MSKHIYKYHYTYQITNIEEQKHYIGVRSCNIHHIEDIGVKYFGSKVFNGKLDKLFIQRQKDYSELYEYKILGLFETRELACLNEVELHEIYDVGRNPRFYNGVKAKLNGFDRTGTYPTSETIQKMKLAWNEENKKERSIKYMHEKHPYYKGKIQQYDAKTGEFIKEADSWDFKKDGFSIGNISDCINRKQKTHRRCIWKRGSNLNKIKETLYLNNGENNNNYKGKVQQIDIITGKIIKEANLWEFTSNGFNKSNISGCINHPEKHKSAYGFIWKRN